MGYVMELRRLIGTHPIIMAGACVLLTDDKNRLLLKRRTEFMRGAANQHALLGRG